MRLVLGEKYACTYNKGTVHGEDMWRGFIPTYTMRKQTVGKELMPKAGGTAVSPADHGDRGTHISQDDKDIRFTHDGIP